jgi:phosphatidyl-myo-inositol dimannoside synthase
MDSVHQAHLRGLADAAKRSGPGYLLVTEVFPPSVGGSGVLLENVYSRVRGRVTALVDDATGATQGDGALRVIRTHIDGHAWGLFDPSRWRSQARLAGMIYRYGANGRAITHCGRAQPEAVAALLASVVPRGPRYLFWVHGEDIAAAMSSRQYATTMRLVYGRASAVIANSQNTARMVRSLGWHRRDVHVVYPGVDAVRFHPAADDGTLRCRLAPRGELLLLSVARLQKRKGHELVLRALVSLRSAIPAVKYVIVGAGGEREALERLVATLGLQGLVQFEGEVPDAALQGYFAACDIFVLPTRVEPHDFEGFGIVYLEAAAAGKPAIGGRNGGVPEAIVDGETGILVSGEDAEELAGALQRLGADGKLRSRLGCAARERVLRDFTWERAAAQVTEIHCRLARSV